MLHAFQFRLLGLGRLTQPAGAAILLFLAAVTGGAQASNLAAGRGGSTECSVDRWQTSEDLAHGSVHAIQPASEGELWVVGVSDAEETSNRASEPEFTTGVRRHEQLLAQHSAAIPPPRQKASATGFSNPIMPGADPHALVLGNTVWIYPTWNKGDGKQFHAFASTDLKNWERHGPVLDFKDVRWIKDDGQDYHHAWAPAVIQRGGRFYFYYSVGPQQQTPARIGVAVGDQPGGPFRDSGKPLLTGGNGFEAIDPMVFVDPPSGKYFFYAGGSAGATLRVFELNEDMISFVREIRVETPPNFTEGAFIHFHGGKYHFTYSHGSWRDSTYSVHYATADSPTGPWQYRGAILTSDTTRKGPGHHSIIRSPLNGEWLLVYHRWDKATGDGPYRGSRQICIERLEYDAAGFIRPVVMTDADPATAPGTGIHRSPKSSILSSVFVIRPRRP